MVETTDVAKDKLKELLNENPGKYLRIVMGENWLRGLQLGIGSG